MSKYIPEPVKWQPALINSIVVFHEISAAEHETTITIQSWEHGIGFTPDDSFR